MNRWVIAKPYHRLFFYWWGNCGSVDSDCWGFSISVPRISFGYIKGENWIRSKTLLDVCWSRSGWWFRLFGNGYGFSWNSDGLRMLYPARYLYSAEFKTATKPLNKEWFTAIIHKREIH